MTTPEMMLVRLFSALLMGAAIACAAQTGAQRAPKVLAEETVYAYEPANNGAGPMWCYGSTCVVRIGSEVFVSGLETIPGAKPLNNTRWVLHRRDRSGWHVLQRDEKGRTREPCPIAAIRGGWILLSANPALTPLDAYNGPARPEVLRFRASAPSAPPETLLPVWQGAPSFTEHTYRGLCADGPARSALLMNIEGHSGLHWSYLGSDGRWSASGKLVFPMGVDYPKPEPIRLCYPVLAMKNRAAHMLAISDIIEPIPEWRAFKKQLTRSDWDYDFRRLFYAWSPDVTRQGFTTPIEVASREKTCGHITNLDIWLERPDRAHLLWLERSVWYPQMRDRFFPGTPLTVSLEHAVVERGKVVSRSTLAIGGEGADTVSPGYGRFHVSSQGRLFVFAYFHGADASGKPVSENRLLELDAAGRIARWWSVPLKRPFSSFMTATERAGAPPSDVLDIIGPLPGQSAIGYAQVRVP